MRTGRLAAAGAAAGGSRWLRHIAYGFDDHDKRTYPELAATNERIHERTSENVRVLSVRRLLLVDERPNCDDDWRRRTTGDERRRTERRRTEERRDVVHASEREREKRETQQTCSPKRSFRFAPHFEQTMYFIFLSRSLIRFRCELCLIRSHHVGQQRSTKMDENGMSDSQARNSLSNTPTHHVCSLIERVMEKQRCETIRHNFFFFCIILKKSGVVVLAKKKMNKRKPPPPPPRQAQKRTSCKKRKGQTKKAKGGKAAASSGEREEQETKGTSAVISRSNTLFFFPELKTAHSQIIICLIRRTFSARS